MQQERMEKEAEVRRVRAELLRKAREEDPLAWSSSSVMLLGFLIISIHFSCTFCLYCYGSKLSLHKVTLPYMLLNVGWWWIILSLFFFLTNEKLVEKFQHLALVLFSSNWYCNYASLISCSCTSQADFIFLSQRNSQDWA